MSRRLCYFGTVLPRGERKRDSDLKYYEFSENQMRQLTLSGKPHCDEHDPTPLGKVIMSRVSSENGKMYVIGEITDEKLIDEIEVGKKMGLSLRHDYKLFITDDGGWVERKKLAEVSSTTKPLREGQYILAFFIDDREQQNTDEAKGKSRANFQAENQPEQNISKPSSQISSLTAFLQKSDMSDSAAASAGESAAESDETKSTVPGEVINSSDAKELVRLVLELHTANDVLQQKVTKTEQEHKQVEEAEAKIAALEKQREEDQKSLEEMRLQSSQKTRSDVKRFIDTISTLYADLGEESASLPMSESDFPNEGEQFNSELPRKLYDTVTAVAAAAHKKLSEMETQSDSIDGIKRKRKRFTSPTSSSNPGQQSDSKSSSSSAKPGASGDGSSGMDDRIAEIKTRFAGWMDVQ